MYVLLDVVMDLCVEEYEAQLEALVKQDKVHCSKCGNRTEFMVNELGHVFCDRCYKKIPNIRFREK